MDMDMDKEKGEAEGDKSENYQKMFRAVSKELEFPEGFAEIILTWLKYKSEKGQSYKPTGLKAFIKKLIKDTDGDSGLAESWIEHSMSNNYTGVYPPSKEKPEKKRSYGKSISKIPDDYDPYARFQKQKA